MARSAHAPNEARDGGGLASLGVVVRHRGEAVLFQEGDEAEACYRVLSGGVRLYRMLEDGRRHIVAFALAGDFFAWDDEARHGFAAETVGAATLVRYPKARLEGLLAERPEMAVRLLALARRELRLLRAQALLLARKGAGERLASFLLTLAGDGAVGAAGPVAVALPMTRADIADHLGLTVETVSRCFSRLRRDGVIALDGQRACRLLDPAHLQALAAGAPAGLPVREEGARLAA